MHQEIDRVSDMPYITIQDYAKLKNISRQAVDDRISRGALACSFKLMKVKRKVIFVNSEELKELARMQEKE